MGQECVRDGSEMRIEECTNYSYSASDEMDNDTSTHNVSIADQHHEYCSGGSSAEWSLAGTAFKPNLDPNL